MSILTLFARSKGTKKMQINDIFMKFVTKSLSLGYIGIPSLFSGITPKSQNFFMENKANFTDRKIAATTCSGSAYNNLLSKFRQKSKPKANPIPPQFPPGASKFQRRRKASISKRHAFVQILLFSAIISPL